MATASLEFEKLLKYRWMKWMWAVNSSTVAHYFWDIVIKIEFNLGKNIINLWWKVDNNHVIIIYTYKYCFSALTRYGVAMIILKHATDFLYHTKRKKKKGGGEVLAISKVSGTGKDLSASDRKLGLKKQCKLSIC